MESTELHSLHIFFINYKVSNTRFMNNQNMLLLNISVYFILQNNQLQTIQLNNSTASRKQPPTTCTHSILPQLAQMSVTQLLFHLLLYIIDDRFPSYNVQ